MLYTNMYAIPSTHVCFKGIVSDTYKVIECIIQFTVKNHFCVITVIIHLQYEAET